MTSNRWLIGTLWVNQWRTRIFGEAIEVFGAYRVWWEDDSTNTEGKVDSRPSLPSGIKGVLLARVGQFAWMTELLNRFST